MPLDEDEIEFTAEEPEILMKMKRGKYYSFDELFKMMYGEDVKRERELLGSEVLPIAFSHQVELRVILTLLVQLKRIKTATTKEGEPKYLEIRGKPILVSGEKVPREPEVYYGIPRQRH